MRKSPILDMEIQLSQHLSWKPVLFSLNGLGRLVKNQLHAFISRLHILFHQSICPIFMPITQCFDYCRFLTFETKHVSPPTIFSGFQESLAIVGPLQMKSPLAFPFLQNSNWEFWYILHWTCRLHWVALTLWQNQVSQSMDKGCF